MTEQNGNSQPAAVLFIGGPWDGKLEAVSPSMLQGGSIMIPVQTAPAEPREAVLYWFSQLSLRVSAEMHGSIWIASPSGVPPEEILQKLRDGYSVLISREII